MTTLRIENVTDEPIALVVRAARLGAPERVDARVIPVDELAPGEAVRVKLEPGDTLLVSEFAP